MKLNTLACAVVAILLSACSGKNADHHHEEQAQEVTATTEKAVATTAPQYTADPVFKKQLTVVFDHYATLKDALVSSDAGKVKQEATATLGAVAKVDMKLVTGAAHHDWMTYLEGIEKSLAEMGASADLAVQRIAFSTLSTDLYKAIKAFGLDGQTAYYDFCPMAFDNKGAYWLAKEDKIRNPYFGDEMLTCGTVEEEIIN